MKSFLAFLGVFGLTVMLFFTAGWAEDRKAVEEEKKESKLEEILGEARR